MKYYLYTDNKPLTRKVIKILRKHKLPTYVLQSIYVEESYNSQYRVYSRTIVSKRVNRMILSIWSHIEKEINITINASMMKPKPIINTIPLCVRNLNY